MPSDSFRVLNHASDVCVAVNSVVVSRLIDQMTTINIKYCNGTARGIIIIIIIIIIIVIISSSSSSQVLLTTMSHAAAWDEYTHSLGPI